jgi:hypothetical protein
MGKLQGFRRLYKQDFDQQYGDLIDGLSPALNTGVEVLYQALNKNLDLANNIRCTVRDVSVIVNASGVPKSITSIALDVKNAPVIGCQVISAQNVTNSSTFPTGQPFISFSQKSDVLIINNVTGLQADNQYTLKIICWN